MLFSVLYLFLLLYLSRPETPSKHVQCTNMAKGKTKIKTHLKSISENLTPVDQTTGSHQKQEFPGC